MMDKLKPCPFCGGRAVYRRGGADYLPHGWSAGCDNGHAESPGMDSKSEAREWWNTRSRPPSKAKGEKK